jgi:hypothetical protein
VRSGYNYVGAGPRTDTQADNAFSTRISVNRQLAPNLTQQQVDPLALPGFDLPTGQNGLFRMSGDGSATPTQGAGLLQVRGLHDNSIRSSPHKYLMNNAIASKDALHLSLGVSLTAEQVAALTHDIVWMETRTVNNQQVLVPVLYLANANHRLAANGALIQGADVSTARSPKPPSASSVG